MGGDAALFVPILEPGCRGGELSSFLSFDSDSEMDGHGHSTSRSAKTAQTKDVF